MSTILNEIKKVYEKQQREIVAKPPIAEAEITGIDSSGKYAVQTATGEMSYRVRGPEALSRGKSIVLDQTGGYNIIPTQESIAQTEVEVTEVWV